MDEDVLESGDLLNGRYRIGDLVAHGGMADVFSARDEASDTKVAVKALRAASDLDRFRIEAGVLESIDHPGIVALRDVGEHHGVSYIVMDFIGGISLRDLIRRDGPMSADEIGVIGRDIAGALAHAHSHGIVHRDVKPANVLVDRDGRAHLADFGIARTAEASGLTATGMTMGTAAYLAPEQVTGGKTGPPADVYALGLVLIEAFTGKPAYEGSTAEAALARLNRDPEIPDYVPGEWTSLLRSMTSREVVGRPPTEMVAAALAAGAPELSAFRDTELTAVLPTVSGAELAAATPGRRRVARLSLVAVVAVFGLVALFAVQPAILGGDETSAADEEDVTDIADDEVDESDGDEEDEAESADDGQAEEPSTSGGRGGGGHPHGGPPGKSNGRGGG
jgi:eukaryotic-like serine/threonine-protein kinase